MQHISKSDPLINQFPDHLKSFDVNLNEKTEVMLSALKGV
jgi:hypothetical protein